MTAANLEDTRVDLNGKELKLEGDDSIPRCRNARGKYHFAARQHHLSCDSERPQRELPLSRRPAISGQLDNREIGNQNSQSKSSR
jgi:hypothetical protein